MKFSLARTVPVLALALSLASCGGGGKATFPVTVTVNNLTESGLIMDVGGQDYAVPAQVSPATSVTFTFPNTLSYGDEYAIIPKGSVLSGNALLATNLGAQPLHETCQPSTVYPYNLLVHGTAGQLAKIQVYYDCTVNSYPLTGTITGLTADGLVLANGTDTLTVAANTTTFSLTSVTYGNSFGVSVLTQPTGLFCAVTGGNGSLNNGSGKIDAAAAAAATPGVNNILVTCTPKT